METSHRTRRLRTGWLVFAGLAVLTAIEYVLSLSLRPNTPYLAVTALVKAGLIVAYFMHVAQLWRAEGGHE